MQSKCIIHSGAVTVSRRCRFGEFWFANNFGLFGRTTAVIQTRELGMVATSRKTLIQTCSMTDGATQYMQGSTWMGMFGPVNTWR